MVLDKEVGFEIVIFHIGFLPKLNLDNVYPSHGNRMPASFNFMGVHFTKIKHIWTMLQKPGKAAPGERDT